jgi:hypothetical protein
MQLSLTVKSLTTHDLLLEIDSDQTVAALKQRISLKTNLSTSFIRLVYCGKLLNDSYVLDETIKESKLIHLIVSNIKLPEKNQNISTDKNTNPTFNTLSLPRNSQLVVIK